MIQWYLLQHHDRQYASIFQQLADCNVDYYTPFYTRFIHRTDKKNLTWRKKQTPLFPGYLFIYFDVKNIHTTTLKKIPGVVGFVRRGRQIITVPETVIAALKLLPANITVKKTNEIECRNVDPAMLAEVEKIASHAEPYFRFSALINLLDEVMVKGASPTTRGNTVH
ncbi:transcription termination/antitermination NusG family protein [Candidatus Fukatsuia symbiotica]|uniref:transcription termination/antitermination NusG family protein n=1 Tax=Candidatus Fukatsuia symbiotica TaxID=1878942 RepID=UPI0013C465E3|nr:transcription termination/antitermination NusG family protein [Candidatus Fukatsuia symbiotica]